MSHRDEYRHWPFLNSEEFELACAFLDQRYVRANLGASRRSFKLRLRRTITTGSSHIEILRILRLSEEDQELTSQLERLWNGTTGAVSATDMEVDMANEETDHEALCPATASHQPPSYSEYSHQPYVIYEIHLHPTYNVPTLWFTLHDLPMGEPAFNLDSVYRYLVPDEFKGRLRAAGIAGGLSAAPHPVTDVPAFFIHPCQTKEAMENFDCSLQNYLMVWIGLVGSCVGLWVPREMAVE